MRTSLPALFAVVIAAYSTLPAQAQDRSADYSEPHQVRALEIYRTLIEYRTAAGHGQVPAMAEYLAEQFRAGGFPPEDIHVLPFTVESGEEVAGLVVRYRGGGVLLRTGNHGRQERGRLLDLHIPPPPG